MLDLTDRFETTDGSRPESVPLAVKQAAALPLSAFAILAGGDVFEARAAAASGEAQARQYVQERVTLADHGASRQQRNRVIADIVRQLSGNPNIALRMLLAHGIVIDLVRPGQSLAALGFPRAVTENVAGFFWDHPHWEHARIALRQERLDEDASLVFHEIAHAVHYLAFSEPERKQIYGLLRPTFGSRAAMDEVFAIYSERELSGDFSEAEKKAPDVYGFARAQWSQDHVFTRFVRKLYFPRAPLAGPGMPPLSLQDWTRKLHR